MKVDSNIQNTVKRSIIREDLIGEIGELKTK